MPYCLKFLTILLLTGWFSFSFQEGNAQQRFEGAVVFGFNASQIDGDFLAGYDKLGLTGGLKLGYGLQKPWYLSMEFLYSQRGSQSELLSDGSVPIRKINLQYIEVPVLIQYKDWWISAEEYYKVYAEAGLSYGYLFDASKSEGSFTIDTEDFRSHDVSYMLGVAYHLSPHWGFGFRYTRSITRLYENPDSGERDLLGYFLSFRVMYQF